MRMRSLLMLLMVFVATVGFPKQASDIPVTTYLADVDNTNTAYYVQSDGSGGVLTNHGLKVPFPG